MHTLESRIMGCDTLIRFDGNTVAVEPDSCEGITATSDITLDDLYHLVRNQIWAMQYRHRIWLQTRVIPCEGCGRDKNHDTSACSCPGCASFREPMPCQFECRCGK